jgi:hypothetical protein
MPSHKLHKYVDKLMFGKAYPEVHKALDKPCFWLGKKHRILFHDPLSAMILAYKASNDSYGWLSGYMHTWLDKKCSKDKMFKAFLEFVYELCN